jgi:hypothetical protein
MIQAFFPANFALAESNWLGNYLLNELLFPSFVSEICPEVVIEIHGVSIRQPVLAMSALVGLAIGIACGLRLCTKLWTLNETKRPRRLPRHLMWTLAFLSFGLMNLSALPLHCFLPAPKTTYPDEVSKMKV